MDITFIIFRISSVLLLIYFFYLVYFYFVTIKKWKIAKGEILESKWIQGIEDLEEKIVYTFYINGISYNNNMITKNIRVSFPFQNKTKLRYKVGQKINVYYNPKKPKESVLDHKFRYENYLILIFVVVTYFVAGI